MESAVMWEQHVRPVGDQQVRGRVERRGVDDYAPAEEVQDPFVQDSRRRP